MSMWGGYRCGTAASAAAVAAALASAPGSSGVWLGQWLSGVAGPGTGPALAPAPAPDVGPEGAGAPALGLVPTPRGGLPRAQAASAASAAKQRRTGPKRTFMACAVSMNLCPGSPKRFAHNFFPRPP